MPNARAPFSRLSLFPSPPPPMPQPCVRTLMIDMVILQLVFVRAVPNFDLPPPLCTTPCFLPPNCPLYSLSLFGSKEKKENESFLSTSSIALLVFSTPCLPLLLFPSSLCSCHEFSFEIPIALVLRVCWTEPTQQTDGALQTPSAHPCYHSCFPVLSKGQRGSHANRKRNPWTTLPNLLSLHPTCTAQLPSCLGGGNWLNSAQLPSQKGRFPPTTFSLSAHHNGLKINNEHDSLILGAQLSHPDISRFGLLTHRLSTHLL